MRLVAGDGAASLGELLGEPVGSIRAGRLTKEDNNESTCISEGSYGKHRTAQDLEELERPGWSAGPLQTRRCWLGVDVAAAARCQSPAPRAAQFVNFVQPALRDSPVPPHHYCRCRAPWEWLHQ